MAKISEFFDVSIAEEIEATFTTTSADKVFLFSGPPRFTQLANDHSLCPLLFTTQFADNERRNPGPELPSLGTTDTVNLPSSGGRNSFSIGGGAVLTGLPKNIISKGNISDANTTSDETIDLGADRWNLLKRFYYDVINYEGGKLLNYFLPKESANSKKSSIGFKVVGSSPKDMFTNFSKSEFYDIPIGLLEVALNKSHSAILVRYLEGVKINNVGAKLQTQAGGSATFQGGIQASYKDELPLNEQSVKNLGLGGTEYSTFIETLKGYMK